MKVSIVGVGYVGLITGSCFAELGNDVVCVDVVSEKVEKINRGESPIYEEGLDGLLKKNIGQRLKATTDLEYAVLDSEVTFICVGTPDAPGGGIDLKYIRSAAEGVGKALAKKSGYHVVVVKSTVVPGTTDSVVMPILELESGKRAGEGFGMCMNPEFLREGRAIQDFMEPDRVVIGALDDMSAGTLEKLYESFECPKLRTDLRTAEMIKYASNALLATKISFINEVANICEKTGVDVGKVAEGVGLDSRISAQFLQAGAGFGGSCFPKDVKAIVELAKKNGYEPLLLDSVLEVNKRQALHMVEELEKRVGAGGDDTGLEGKRIAVLGLAFKPGTDDIRESPMLKIIPELLKKGAEVIGFDPIAMENTERVFANRMIYAKGPEECIREADGCLILTDWKEFKLPATTFKEQMKSAVIIDGRRLLDVKEMRDAGINYYGVGYGD